MSRFYGSMQGRRGAVTRCGDSISGVTSHVRGWDIGARVTVRKSTLNNDAVDIEITKGSNSPDGMALCSFIEPNVCVGGIVYKMLISMDDLINYILDNAGSDDPTPYCVEEARAILKMSPLVIKKGR